MEILARQVRRARRRLAVQQFLLRTPWCWFFAMLVAMSVVAADRFAPWGFQPANRLSVWAGLPEDAGESQTSWLLFGVAIGAAFVFGAIASAAWTWWTRQSVLDAAVEIDRRFGLRERLSSSLALTPEQRETSAGQALLDDALRRVRDLQVREKFALRLDRWSLLPLAPAAVAFAIAMFWHPEWDTPRKAGARSTASEKKRIEVSTTKLQNQAVDKRKKAEEQGLEKAQELFKKLEQTTEDIAKSPDADKEKALNKLKDLAQELQKRQEELGTDKLKEQFEQMKNVPQGPADKMAQAMKDGNFKKAERELKKLAEKLKEGKLDDKEKADLQKQLAAMQDKLGKMADAHEKAMRDLREQIEKRQKAGNKAEAEKLKKQLAKLAKDAKAMGQCKAMGKKLGNAAQQMNQGDAQAAAQALQKLADEMGQMELQLAELAMLAEMMADLDACKNGMCEGDGNKPGTGEGAGNKRNKSKNARGKGRGAGEREEKENKTGLYDTRIKPKTPGAEGTIADFVPGMNSKGDVVQGIVTEFNQVKGGEADPLTSQPLSREYRDHAEEYFESLVDPK